jgi:hypothetical protein
MFDSALPRRELLRIGALSLFGALSSRSLAAERTSPRSCIFILLQGGASHHDLWDPKPEAPAEVRGPFGTLATALPGVRFGELLPRTAAIADKLVIVRSMTHQFTNHIAGTYITLTGSTNQPDADARPAQRIFPAPVRCSMLCKPNRRGCR